MCHTSMSCDRIHYVSYAARDKAMDTDVKNLALMISVSSIKSNGALAVCDREEMTTGTNDACSSSIS